MLSENARLWFAAISLWLITTVALGWSFWRVWASLEALL
jgi:hypothetical protein